MVFAQLALHQLECGEYRALRAAGAQPRRTGVHGHRLERDHLGRRRRQPARQLLADEGAQALVQHLGAVLAGHWQRALADQPGLQVVPAQHAGDALLDEVRLAFFHQQHRALAGAEARELGVDQRVGDVHHVQRQPAVAEDIGQAQPLHRAQQRVVQPALHDDADVGGVFGEELVEPTLLDEALRRRPALLDLLALVQETGRRQHDAVDIALRRGQCLVDGKGRAAVVLGNEAAVHMAGADAQLQHHRRVRGFRQLEALLHGLHDARQIGPRVQQPHLRLHCEGMAALLHDAGAVAVVLADDDQRTAGDTARGQVGQRIRRDVGAHGGLESHRTAQRVVHRRGQGGRGGGLAGAGLEAHAHLGQDVLRVGQHVHQVRDRRALVAGDVSHARLQQRLGDGQDAFAGEFLARAEPQLLDFLGKGSFGHRRFPCGPCA